MACKVKELREWLDSLDVADDRLIGIDDGGLQLVVHGEEDYYDIGGMLEHSDDERFGSTAGTDKLTLKLILSRDLN